MRKSILIAALLGVLLVAAPFGKLVQAEDEPDVDIDEAPEEPEEAVDETDVVVLKAGNWDEIVGKSKYALIEFYAPWCGHCQSLKPEWAKAATALKALDATVVIAKVDATEEQTLAETHGVQGYPTLKWFVNGEFASDYSGPRESDGIVKWVQKKTGPPAVTVETVEELTKTEEASAVVAVGFFKKLEGEEYDTFVKAAQMDDDVAFVQTTSAKVAKAAGLTKPGVILITKFAGEERKTIEASGELAAFIKAEKMPPTLEFNDDNSHQIFNSGIEKQILLVATAEDLQTSSTVFQTYLAVAKALKGEVVYVTVDLGGSYKDAVVDYFGLKEEEAPIVVGFDMSNNRKYRLDGDLTEAPLSAFVKSVVDGSAEPITKSAPVPEDDMDGKVKIVVGKTFESIVKDDSKDVLLEVYAPWCGHCKAIEPMYQKLAERFSSVDSIIIAKMDGTENEHPDADVEGFPTLLFFPAGGEMERVEARSLKSITAFLKENAKKKFTLPAEVEAEHAAEADEVIEEPLEEGDDEIDGDVEEGGEGEDFEDGQEEEAAEDAILSKEDGDDYADDEDIPAAPKAKEEL